MTQKLEDQLTSLLKIAASWGKQGFATLLQRSTNALVELDRLPFHNAHLKQASYIKSDTSTYACISTEDWISLIESKANDMSEGTQNAFLRWPLVHQFGFIPANAYTKLELKDGEYSPCDLIPMGIIPVSLQRVIETFANELGHRKQQEAKKQFLNQWQTIRATSLLRAISIAMTAGVQVANLKDLMICSLPSHLFESQLLVPKENSEHPKPIQKVNKKTTTNAHHAEKTMKNTTVKSSDAFSCIGITCSSLFGSKTNLRPGRMPKENSTCRRCVNLNQALLIAQAIEQFFSDNLYQFQLFYDSISNMTNLSSDYLIATIAQLKPLPNIILPAYLKRSTKRNVYPIAMTNAMRMLCGTFHWNLSDKPTSLDIVFNMAQEKSSLATNRTECKCTKKSIFFALHIDSKCPSCNNPSSSFTPTASRISLVSLSNKSTASCADTVMLPVKNTNIASTRKTTKISNANRPSNYTASSTTALRDITNVLHAHPPFCLAARPDDAELHAITRINNMLSHFVVSYFFKILASNFPSILYQEFLFDFVKREGGWTQFVQYSRNEGHSTDFLDNLKATTSICIVPICCDIHWTVLIRKFVGTMWEIYYIDSMFQGSDARMRRWQALFQDDDLFSGKWIKLQIIPQTELECGARVCLHGLCYALSLLKTRDTSRQLERVKDLAARSRLLVSRICTDGNWSHPGWLKSIIGTPVLMEPSHATQTTVQ